MMVSTYGIVNMLIVYQYLVTGMRLCKIPLVIYYCEQPVPRGQQHVFIANKTSLVPVSGEKQRLAQYWMCSCP